MASIIVVDAAASKGIPISFRDFCRAGIPVGVVSMLAGAAWIILIQSLGW
jgi:Na+/H+ antiporter NhaD/arsenite permease-like protein